MNCYPLFVACGIILAALIASRQPATPGLDSDQRTKLTFAAVMGAVLGAYLLQLPADLFGWDAPMPAGSPADALPMGGRTVLGGLLGGWLVVEVVKKVLHIRAPSGDGFALPLAIALACGRLGCASAGCCAGRACAEHWWAWHDAAGIARLPVQIIEAEFHAGMAVWLCLAGRHGWVSGRRLAIYLTFYAELRFGLEFVREHPPVLFGLSWYQVLATALGVIAGATWWRRRSLVAVSAVA